MRLPNGYGSVYKLSGKRRRPFVARKTTGWDEKGHPIYQILGYYTTKKEGLNALANYNQTPEEQRSVITFEELYAKWSTIHFQKIGKSAIFNMQSSFKLCQSLHKKQFNDLKLSDFQDIVDKSKKNKPTLKQFKVLISLLYDFAIKSEICPPEKKELARYIDLSLVNNQKKVKRAMFSKEEIEQVANLSEENNICKIINILIFTGLRISELLELRKEEVDLDKQILNITHSKTSAGIRVVPINNKLLPIIEELYANSNTLLCDNIAVCKTYSTFEYHFRKYISEHTIHDTRHTFISLLTEARVDKRIIKVLVGHSGSGVTDQVYTHFNLEDLQNEINKI